MKNKYLLIAVAMLISFVGYAQESIDDEDTKKGLHWNYLKLEGGLNFTNFDYMDSRDEQSLITNMTNSPKEKIGIGLALSPSKFDRLEIFLGAANNNIDVKAYFNSGMSQSYVHYDFDFITMDLGLGLRLLDFGKEQREWSVLGHGGIGLNWLLAGFQDRNNKFVDLKEYEQFDNSNTDFNFGGSLRKKISPYSSIQFSYVVKKGLELQEQANDGGFERYTFNTNVFSVSYLMGLEAIKNRFKREKKMDDIAQKMLDQMEKGDSADQAVADKIRKLLAEQKNLDRKVAKNDHEINSINNQLATIEKDFKNKSGGVGGGFELDENKRLILFPFGKSQFYDVFKTELKELAGMLTENPNDSLNLVGYADIVGSSDYNVKLSKTRAERVRDFLVKEGISKERISVDFQGSTSKFDKYNFLFNRRVEITIIKKD